MRADLSEAISRTNELKEKHTINTWTLFLSFLKIGIIGFGGGSALIPIVEREIVVRRRAMDANAYTKHTVIANITPGALPVKLGATCGFELGGISGALLSAYAVSLPGVLLTIALLALFSLLGREAIRLINYASVGITVFIVFLLSAYTWKTVQSGSRAVNWALCVTAFLLTGGKELRTIAGKLGIEGFSGNAPLFDISTIQLMLISFFMILFRQKAESKLEQGAGFALCMVYAFLSGKTGATFGLSGYGKWLFAAMMVWLISLFLLRRQKVRSRHSEKLMTGKSATLIGIFIGIPLLLIGLGLFAGETDLPEFAGKAAFSTVTSFGGGEAYMSVADGIFVQGGYVEPELFYVRLVPVANALPGPILVKIASGIGYLYGSAKDPFKAGIYALTVMCTAIGACCSIAIFALSAYESIGQSAFVQGLKRYILPVICGMLLSTSFAMLSEAMEITTETGILPLVSFVAMLMGVGGLHLLHRKFRIPDIVTLIGMAGLSVAIHCLLG